MWFTLESKSLWSLLRICTKYGNLYKIYKVWTEVNITAKNKSWDNITVEDRLFWGSDLVYDSKYQTLLLTPRSLPYYYYYFYLRISLACYYLINVLDHYHKMSYLLVVILELNSGSEVQYKKIMMISDK